MAGLRERLLELKGRTGAGGVSHGTDALSGRLSRLQPDGRGRARPRPADESKLARCLGGKLIDKGVILLERRYSLDSVHGKVPLRLLEQGLDGLPDVEGLELERLLFLDTETTGLSGGSGTLVFLLGLARVQGRMMVVRQYLLTRCAGEQRMLEVAGGWVGQGDTLVSYNGKSFDLPMLATRCRLSGTPNPFSALPHLDLLYGVRRAFSKRWRECSLQTAEQRLLEFFRRDDLPGSAAPECWRAWLTRADASCLPGICRHNYWDIVSLAALLPRLRQCHQQPGRHGADVLAIARVHLKRGGLQQALSLLQENRDRLDQSGLLQLARLFRRNRRWQEALEIWKGLAESGNEDAREQLAKYYEHIARDYQQAFACASELPTNAEHLYRCRRLIRKLAH